MWTDEDDEYTPEERRRDLELSITNLLAALQEKHPDDRAEGFVKIILYCDGSGRILDGPDHENDCLFSFEGKEELTDWLDSGQIPEPTERE